MKRFRKPLLHALALVGLSWPHAASGDLTDLPLALRTLQGVGTVLTLPLRPEAIARLAPLSLSQVPESALRRELEVPQPLVFNPEQSDSPPVIFVNGAGITRAIASEEATALARRLKRPVHLIYNDTHGMAWDVAEAAVDRFGHFFISLERLRFNRTVRQLAHLFVHSPDALSVVSHSQGCLLVRNALLVAHQLKPMRHSVAWVATGMPLHRLEIFPEPVQFHSLTNDDDQAARLLANLSGSPSQLVGLMRENRHDFRLAYLDRIPRQSLFADDYSPDLRQAEREDAWAGLWQSNGLASVQFKREGVVFVTAAGNVLRGEMKSDTHVRLVTPKGSATEAHVTLQNDSLIWSSGEIWVRP